MSNHPPIHSNALLIAWRLAELEAANLRSAELEPIHFFLGLLKLSELDLEPILAENTSLSNAQILREIESVQQMASCFSLLGMETTQTRRRLRRSLPSGSGEVETGQHFRRGMASRDVFSRADELALTHGSDSVQPLHLLSSIVDSDCPWVSAALERSGITENDFSEATMIALGGNATDETSDKRSQPQAKKSHGKDPDKRKKVPGFAERIGLCDDN